MSYIALDIIPLEVGTKWLYKLNSKIINTDVRLEVIDTKSDLHLVRIQGGGIEGCVVLKSDVDLSIMAYGRKGIDTLNDMSVFKTMSHAEILKSPIVSGTVWSNSIGEFKIEDSEYTFKSGKNIFSNCVHLRLRDNSNQLNDFYIKEGIGILYASVFIDNVGKVTLSLRKFN